MIEKKACPYCAEGVWKTAVQCPHCQSRLSFFQPEAWHRSHGQGRFLGVCTALARAFSLPLLVVRVAFVGLTFVQLLGPIAYGVFLLVIPKVRGTDSVLQMLLRRALAFAEWIGGGPSTDSSDAPAEPAGVVQRPKHRDGLPAA